MSEPRRSAAFSAGWLAGWGWRIATEVPPALGRSLRFTGPVVLAAMVVAASAGVATVIVRSVAPVYELGTPSRLALEPLAERSSIHAADGTVLTHVHAGENRVLVPLDAMPDHLVAAVLAAEDRRFFEHDGVDVGAVARAFAENLGAGAVVQGGSTITQQLAKLETGRQSDDVWGKAREVGVALTLERSLGKQRILERYLNAAHFGRGTYGVGAAAELYFAKPVEQLDVAEAALLAGMIAAPRRFDPLEQPDRARARRSFALRSLAARGVVTQAELPALEQAPLPAQVHDVRPSEVARPFVAEVTRRLLRDPRLGATYDERYDRLFLGGVTIHTTFDAGVQELADRSVREVLPPGPFTASLAAIDPATGDVKALVGTPVPGQSFNLATQGARQTGSAFKLVTYVAALEAGFSPDDVVDGTAPCEFAQPHGQRPWRVVNYDGPGGQVTSLGDALARSLNCAFARVVQALGPERVADVAGRMGVERHLDPYPSITLGAEEVSPLEMASVAATLAADGVHRPPVFVRRVEAADGSVLFEGSGALQQAIGANVARLATDGLRRVITSGTGRRADIGRPAAGKTGTAQRWRDAWFVGYTPQLAAAVWMGHPDGEVPMENVDGIRVTGGSYPARIWATFMQAAHAGAPVVDFPPPDLSALPDAARIDVDGRHPLPAPDLAPPADEPARPDEGKKRKEHERDDD